MRSAAKRNRWLLARNSEGKRSVPSTASALAGSRLKRGDHGCTCDSARKLVAIYRLRQDWRARHTLVDALDRRLIVAGGYEHDGCAAYLAQPTRCFDSFAASFEANIDQSNVGLVTHSERASVTIARSERTHLKTKVGHRIFEIEGDEDLVLNDKRATA